MLEKVLSAVGAAFGIPPAVIASGNRAPQYARARYAAAMILRDGGWQFEKIGAALSRHHTTIIGGVETGARLVGRSPDFANRLEYARRRVAGALAADQPPPPAKAAPKAETPPAGNVVRSMPVGETFEEAQMRAEINSASARLGALLRREVAA